MAKNFYCILSILFILGCNNNRVPEAGIESKLDSAIADIPIQVDTTFADTSKVVADTIQYAPVKDISEIPVQKNEEIEQIEVIPVNLRLQEIYTSYIGVREKTGSNDGKEVEMFLRSVGLGKGYAWCAAFVKYCMLEAGIKAAERMNGMALSTENKKDFVYHNRKFVKVPQAGDVFTLYYARLGRIGHTGFFDKEINSSIFESVEGNTNNQNSREGDGVYRRKRSYNATYSISRW